MTQAQTTLAEAVEARLRRHINTLMLWHKAETRTQFKQQYRKIADDIALVLSALQSSASIPEREAVAVAIERADKERIPEGYGLEIDNDMVSDWGAYLADAAISACRSASIPEGTGYTERADELVAEWQRDCHVYLSDVTVGELVRRIATGSAEIAAPSIPEGCVVVPVEPNDEMLNAAHAVPHCLAKDDTECGYRNVWKAMLAASPSGPER